MKDTDKEESIDQPVSPRAETKTWEQIIGKYGGDCMYQLVAQCGKTNRYSARSKKSFVPSPPQKESKPVQKHRARRAKNP